MTDFTPVISARSIDTILAFHSLELSDFESKTIVDLGCGYSNLGADLHEQGITATVIGVDMSPQAMDSSLYDEYLEGSSLPVAASICDLPLKDQSVDMALATYSLPLWSRAHDDIERFFSEIRRVVKIGGLVSVYPIAVTTRHMDGPEPFLWDSLVMSAKMGAADFDHSPDWQTFHGVERLKAKRLS